MDNLWICIVIIIFLILLLVEIYFVLNVLFIKDAKKKFSTIEKIIQKMKITILDHKVSLLKIEETDSNLKELKDEIFHFKKQTEFKIEKPQVYFEKEFKKWYYFNPYIFNNKLNNYRIAVLEQYIFYLNINFSLNEYLLEEEINFRILNVIKNQFGEYTKQFINSKVPKIKSSKFLIIEIEAINQEIRDLTAEMKVYSLSPSSKDMIRKIIKNIANFKNNLDFFESSLNFWIFIFYKEINNIKHSISENQEALKNNKAYIIKEINILKVLKEKSISNEPKFEINLVKSAIRQSKLKIIELKKEIDLNIDCYNLLINFAKKTDDIINNFWVDKDDILKFKNYSDSSNKKIDLSKTKNLSILLENAQNDFTILMTNFRANNSKITAYEMFEQFSKLIVIFNDNIKEMLKNQKAVNAIIESTDVVNELVAEINTTLLNSEYDLKTLPVKIKANYAMQLDEFQNKLEKLMSDFQESVRFVDNDKVILVKEILTNAIDLQQKIKRAAFIRFYNENLIIELNKFNNNTSMYLSFIKLIEEAYYKGEQTEVLRLSKKLVENLNIHE